ncbi:MAG: succinate dehydrogenase, hydrophobic membrane anchor protein [Beijerinckiaceae bacterium]
MHSNSSHSMRTPMAKVRGLGSAKSGTEHFFRQRVTALANVPLAIAFVIIITMLLGAPHAVFVGTMKSPLIALVILLFVVSGTIHMRLGMQVIIEDYVHEEGRKIALLIANTFFAIVIAAACVFAVLKMAFAG